MIFFVNWSSKESIIYYKIWKQNRRRTNRNKKTTSAGLIVCLAEIKAKMSSSRIPWQEKY